MGKVIWKKTREFASSEFDINEPYNDDRWPDLLEKIDRLAQEMIDAGLLTTNFTKINENISIAEYQFSSVEAWATYFKRWHDMVPLEFHVETANHRKKHNFTMLQELIFPVEDKDNYLIGVTKNEQN